MDFIDQYTFANIVFLKSKTEVSKNDINFNTKIIE